MAEQNDKRTRIVGPEHPLLHIMLDSRTEREWNALFDRWRDEHLKTVPEFLGILHGGSKFLDIGYPIETIDFYLRAANGYRSKRNFMGLQEFHGTLQAEEDSPFVASRCEISRKAWMILCEHFFKWATAAELKKSERVRAPVSLLINPSIFEELLTFFEPVYGTLADNIPGDPHDRLDGIAIEFLKNFIELIWERGALHRFLRDYSRLLDEQFQEMCRVVRPRTIPILAHIKYTNFLLQCEQMQYDSDSKIVIDERCMQELEKLAFRKYFSRHGRYVTLDEACAQGSHEASVLIILRSIQKEKGRVGELEDLRRLENELKEKRHQIAARSS